LVWINHPPSQKVKEYVEKEFESTPSNPTPLQFEWILKCVGSNFNDVYDVISAIKRGENCYMILRRMISESISQVENHLENILKDAATNDYEIRKKIIW